MVENRGGMAERSLDLDFWMEGVVRISKLIYAINNSPRAQDRGQPEKIKGQLITSGVKNKALHA
jgi:hypothetical protein